MESIEFTNINFDSKGSEFIQIAEKMAKAYGYTADLKLDKELAQLIRLRVATVNKCSYCSILHQETARKLDILQAKIDNLVSYWYSELYSEKEKAALLSLASMYLGLASTGRDGNPVAKFHLGNGAKLHLVNWAGDLSRKGLRQSAGLMVNYLYDLGSVEDNHERFANGEIVYSRAVGRLMAP